MLVELVCQALSVSTSVDGEVNFGISTVLRDVPNNLSALKPATNSVTIGLCLVFGSLLLTAAEVDIDSVVLSSKIGSSVL